MWLVQSVQVTHLVGWWPREFDTFSEHYVTPAKAEHHTPQAPALLWGRSRSPITQRKKTPACTCEDRTCVLAYLLSSEGGVRHPSLKGDWGRQDTCDLHTWVLASLNCACTNWHMCSLDGWRASWRWRAVPGVTLSPPHQVTHTLMPPLSIMLCKEGEDYICKWKILNVLLHSKVSPEYMESNTLPVGDAISFTNWKYWTAQVCH